jgi:lysyl-tRNA synthetase class 2
VSDPEVGDQRDQRIAKVERVRELGGDPYPVRFDRDATAAELRTRYADLEPGTETADNVRVAGRILLLRRQGKLTFSTVRDYSDAIQLFVADDGLGADRHAEFDELDLGDWIGVEGTVMTTRRGELSVKVTDFVLLSKALRPLPDKWHGLADVEARFRQREVDLIANDDARRVFAIRHSAIATIRRELVARDFVEVETPVLHEQAGGATARPFETHHHALDLDLHLRIALELHLKRLVVGGVERVFELGRVFRNEGIGTRYNPEFTMLEAYQALADYTDMMELMEQLVAACARDALGTTTIEAGDRSVDLTPPWPRRPILELVGEAVGTTVHPTMPIEELEQCCDAHEVLREKGWDSGKLILELYEKLIEPELAGPTFVTDYPLEVSPLARAHRDDPALVERFEVVVLGRELANAYSELNDPLEQRRRFEAQAALVAAGDDEAHGVDEDYLRAMEFGLPPTGGLGIGVDRLIMLLAGVGTIRDVILFPTLRPEQTP